MTRRRSSIGNNRAVPGRRSLLDPGENLGGNGPVFAAEIAKRRGGVPVKDGFLIDCPIEQWLGATPHQVLLRDDWRRGLVIKCLDGHSRRDVIAALKKAGFSL
jgi:hypothetical protein